MDEPRYPIGVQTFSKIIEGDYVYVDKTQYIKPLLKHGQYIFLSRPRRFGKSLLLSTLEAYFEGRRDLFKGLSADSADLDWTPRPVLHFDFNTGFYALPNGLEERIDDNISVYEAMYGLSVDVSKNVATRFGRLIRHIYETTGQQAVILVDEYDKPLLDIEDNEELYERNLRMLKSFYSNLKTMDRYISFVFITGVARFSRVSIFSDLNNLNDVSLINEYADLCGWNENELLCYFHQGIEKLAEEREEDFETTLKEMRDFYDGYLFAPKGSRLYNPYSVLKALGNKEIDPYWFDSGTPTFLARRLRKRGIFPPDVNGTMCSRKELISVGLNDRNPIPLMFQTGYLTIAGYDKDMQLYTLRFPNLEVETGFYEELLQIYVPEITDYDSPFNFTLFKQDLFAGRPDDFMKRLAALLTALPYEDHCEPAYRAITFLLSVLSGSRAIAEHHGHKGRSDIEVVTTRFVYVFEFKYNKSVREAMDQIRDRQYAARYALDSRPVYLIAANFCEDKENRGLHYEIVTDENFVE